MRDDSLNNRMFASIHMNLLNNINLQVVADHCQSKRNTNELFWVKLTLTVHRLIIDIIPCSKGPFMLM